MYQPLLNPRDLSIDLEKAPIHADPLLSTIPEDEECPHKYDVFLSESTDCNDTSTQPTTFRLLTKNATVACTISLMLLGFLWLLVTGRSMDGSVRQSSTETMQPVVVLASYAKQDVSWLSELPEPWTVHRYCNDCGPNITRDEYGPRYPVPASYGREAAAYLTFIIDNYDNLPPYSFFLHGHDVAWHQPERAVDLLRALNLTALDEEGYIPSRCTSASCDPNAVRRLPEGPLGVPSKGFFEHLFLMMRPFWHWAFVDTMHEYNHDTQYQCVKTGQFAVTAAAIRSRPLEGWIALREPLMNKTSISDLDDTLRDIAIDQWGIGENVTRDEMFGASGDESTSVNDWSVGVLFELTWHKIFGKEAVHCPDKQTCRDKFFSGAFDCPIYRGDPHVIPLTDTPGPQPCSIDETAMSRIRESNKAILGF